MHIFNWLTYESEFSDLADKLARYEAQRAERETLVEEIAQKTTQVAQLNEEIRKKTQTMTESDSTNMSSKLEYFEAEVRRLESQLTQQKVSYERQIEQL